MSIFAIKNIVLSVYSLFLVFSGLQVYAQEFEINCLTVNFKNDSTINDTISFISGNNDVVVEFKQIIGDSVHYEYQLQGFEMDWVKVSYPLVRYMGLRQGNYRFIIKAFSKNKEIAQKSLIFNVKPSITEVWWFYPVVGLSAFLLIIGGVYLFLLYNFRQKMKVQQLRNKIASDLHDEIGSTLSSIAISSSVVNKQLAGKVPEIEDILHQIKIDSEETVLTIRDTVWALNPDNDSFDVLIEKIRSFSKQILPLKGIKLIFENNIKDTKSIKLGIENRKNLFLILKEIINNIAKHSEATEAKIILNKKSDLLSFEIIENGKGFDTEMNYEGNGLKNLQKRALESIFELKIDSKIGEGTYTRLETLIV